MKKHPYGLLCLILLLFLPFCLGAGDTAGIRKLCKKYIETWKEFYPSRAFSCGFLDSRSISQAARGGRSFVPTLVNFPYVYELPPQRALLYKK